MRDQALHGVLGEDANSIAVNMRHIAGNAGARFTDFLNSDGEKRWRDRDGEFNWTAVTRDELLADRASGWASLLLALDGLSDDDPERLVYIRNEGHSAEAALHRQLAHYAHHVGQIVMLSRVFAGSSWASLSFPRGRSQAFNAEKFAEAPHRKHFTEGEDTGR